MGNIYGSFACATPDAKLGALSCTPDQQRAAACACTCACSGVAVLVFAPPAALGAPAGATAAAVMRYFAAQAMTAGGLAGVGYVLNDDSDTNFDWHKFAVTVAKSGGTALLVNGAGFAAGYGTAKLVMSLDLAEQLSGLAMKAICVGAGAAAGAGCVMGQMTVQKYSESGEQQRFQLFVKVAGGALVGGVAGQIGAQAAGLGLFLSNTVIEVVDEDAVARYATQAGHGRLTIHVCDEKLNGLAPYRNILQNNPQEKMLFLESHGCEYGGDAFRSMCDGDIQQAVSYMGPVGKHGWSEWLELVNGEAACYSQNPGTTVISCDQLAIDLDVFGKGVDEGAKALNAYVQAQGFSRVCLTTCWGARSKVVQQLVECRNVNVDLVVGGQQLAGVGVAEGVLEGFTDDKT